MKKKCLNCKNFSVFYTKIGMVYYQEKFGRCWRNKCIPDCKDACDRWEEDPAHNRSKREKLIAELNEVIANLSIIKTKLNK